MHKTTIEDKPTAPFAVTEPQHQHDCAHCQFLFGGGHLDLYWCIENGTGPVGSIIARHGDKPEAYASAPVLTALGFRPDTPTISAMRDAAAFLVREGKVTGRVDR